MKYIVIEADPCQHEALRKCAEEFGLLVWLGREDLGWCWCSIFLPPFFHSYSSPSHTLSDELILLG